MIKQSDIKKKTGRSAMFISSLVRGLKHTTDKDLAVEVSKLTGKAPIEHITKKLRPLYLSTWPELGCVPDAA
jgi:hypothetical protein